MLAPSGGRLRESRIKAVQSDGLLHIAEFGPTGRGQHLAAFALSPYVRGRNATETGVLRLLDRRQRGHFAHCKMEDIS